MGAPGQNKMDSAQKSKWPTARRALAFVAPDRGLLGLLFLVVILMAAIGIINPLIYRYYINNGILKANYSLIIRLALLVAVLGLAEGGLGLARSYLSSRVGAQIVLRLRTRLFNHIQQMPLAFFTHTQTGALVNRVSNDVREAGLAFTDGFSNIIGNLITVVLTVGAMFALSWRITLAFLVLPPLLLVLTRSAGRRLRAITREQYDLLSSMNSLMVERFNVAGAYLVKVFGRRHDESQAFERSAARVSHISIKRTVYGRIFFSSLFVMSSFATALAYGWGGVLVTKHTVDLGTVVALIAYLAELYSPLVGLSDVQVTVISGLVIFERVFEVFDLSPAIEDKPGALTVAAGPPTIAFNRVVFRYPSVSEVPLASLESTAISGAAAETPVLCDITFTAEAGQMVALVGRSGAGKTTITHLLARLYDIQSGSITLNGIDIRDARLDSLYERIGVVTQEPHFFHDSIRANLLYARPDATEVKIIEALLSAQILPLITSLPRGLDTIVGEGGYRFSGGEKQRLAIARVLLKAPDIIILDEATSHLDSESEAAIQKALEKALAGRTSIVIAHRLSTILRANKILVMDKGRIVQCGTHADLLQMPGVYSALYQQQFASTQMSGSS